MKKQISRIAAILMLFSINSCNMVPNQIKKDWLIDNTSYKAKIIISDSSKDITICNGLVERIFRIEPNVACTGYKNRITGQQLLRAVKPEAELFIDGKKYNIGGLNGQEEQAYLLPEWIDSFTSDENDFQYVSYSESEIKPYINWKQTFWAGKNTQPSGKTLAFLFNSKNLKGIEVVVHYELYDGLPLIVKWLSVKNGSNKPVEIGRVVNEKLALVEEESAVVGSSEEMKKQHGIYVETNYAFSNAIRYDISDQTTHWKADPDYTSQVNYSFQTPCLLEVYPEKVTAVALSPGESFKSVRTHELLMDSYDRERRGLSIRKMYRTVAPWTNQNPIFMHLVSENDEEVKNAISQCAATGYEALILSFGSHCNMEDTTSANIRKWKGLARLAHENDIKIGGYSLFSSRRISDEDDVIDPATGKPDAAAFFGHAPCLGSKWGLGYVEKLKYFIKETGFDIFENDGPYPGDVCASATHPGHSGLRDSQWKQMEMQKALYRWCNENGVYVNAPDWYFMDGSHKIDLGYREVNFSLPRDQQKILNRQNIFDGTWEKTPSMSWGFVPLTRYHGGGEEAVLEPLSQHTNDYEQLMAQYYGAGVQACYRGPRLYDTEETKQLVIRVIDWYKKHREVLNSDIIHLRRADGRDWDGFLHVNPAGEEKGLLMLFNPLRFPIKKEIEIPVYYTGLSEKVKIGEKGGKMKTHPISRDYVVSLTVTIPANNYTWFILK